MHFERGHDYRRAVQYCEQAGKNAIRRSAHREAVAHLTRGLELLKTLPATPERSQQELALQVALGAPLLATKGYAAPEVGAAYTRARELCQQMGETPQLFPVLMGLRFFYTVKGELQTGRELGEQLLRLAQSEQNPPLLLEAHYALGVPLMLLGEFAAARAHFEQSLACYDPEQYCSRAFLYGHNPVVGCLSIAAWTLWFLGYPEQAFKKDHEAITLAQELSPASLAFALGFSAGFHHFRRDGQVGQEQAERLIVLSREQGFSFWLARGTFQRGWALVEQGHSEEIAQIRQGLAALQATGAEAYGTGFLAILAEACGKIGQAKDGLNVLAEAFALVDRIGEHFYEAELYRLKGELVLQSGVRGPESQEKKQKSKGKSRKKLSVVSSQRPVPNVQSPIRSRSMFSQSH